MIATLVSLLLAGYMIFQKSEIAINPLFMAIVIIVVGTLFVLILALSLAIAWGPLHRAEQNMTPGILEMYRKDKFARLINAWLAIFILASYFIAIVLVPYEVIPKYLLFAIWIVMLGISLDSLYHFSKRILKYLNPFSAITLFTKEATASIQEEREIDLCNGIDALSEISYKAIQRNSTMLATESITQLQKIARIFFASSKSISHHPQDDQSKSLGITDKVSYTMFYLYQRLELVFEKALHAKLEPICSQVIACLGKIAVDAAKFDISMATPPLYSMGKLMKHADQKGMNDVGLKGSCTLLEVGKAIVNDTDITYSELQDPFLSIISTLEEFSKMVFRRDRGMSIQVLKQPFYELKGLFTSGKAASHRDAPVILANIDRVLGEFDALEMVMRTIPTIPPQEPSESTQK